jgi:predicted Rossmann-fold nucleotide-binding protein
MSTRLQEMVAAADELLPKTPRIGVIGSASWFHPDSEITCAAVGKSLANVCSLAVVTGGRPGVGESVGRNFFQSRVDEHNDPHVYHLLPEGCDRPDYGETLFFGRNMVERREVLGRLAKVYLAIGGGPGTEYEANVALSNNAAVTPVGRSGGYAQDLYVRMSVPYGVAPKNWSTLGADEVRPDELANAVKMIVSALLDDSE